MRKLLNIIFIISIIIIAVFFLGYIYDEFVIPKIYLNSNSVIFDDEQTCKELQNCIIKYVNSVNESNENINKFIPLINRSNDKTRKYLEVIKDYDYVVCKKFGKIDDTTYVISYSLFENDDNLYNIIIKLYESKNYYRVLYDEMYDQGRKV